MSRARAQVLILSKPVVPPWDDSGKNVVRAQVRAGDRYTYRVLTVPGAPPPSSRVICEPIYGGAGGYAPGPRQNLRVLLRGLRPRGAALYHYFFAPNPVSSLAGRAQRLVARVKTVQTVCSAPSSFDGVSRLLFTDRVIALSRDTERRIVDAGVDRDRVRMIRPGIEPIPRPDDAQRAAARDALKVGSGPLVVFPGDYEFSGASQTVARAIPLLATAHRDVTVVFACRIKTETSRAIRDRLGNELDAAGASERVLFADAIDDMPSLVGAADVVVMPADNLYAKMDAPLVLLEAMSQGVPLVLADAPPLDEIVAFGGALSVLPEDAEGLAAAVGQILDDRDLARSLGEAGARAVAEHFSATSMARQVEDLYDELINTG
jgi:glycosyltransferase involved in cell wall biosynthesis